MKNNYDETFGGYYARLSWTITELLGLEASAIYGLIYFRSKLEKRYCCESYANMANILNISTSTVKRRIKLLKEEGLIIDIKPYISQKEGDTRWFIVNPDRLQELELELADKKKKEINELKDKIFNAIGGSQRTGDSSQRPESMVTDNLMVGHSELESNINIEISNKNNHTGNSSFKETRKEKNCLQEIEDELLNEDFWTAFNNHTIQLQTLLSHNYDDDELIKELASSCYDFMIINNPDFVEEEEEREMVVNYFARFIKNRIKDEKDSLENELTT